MDSSTHVVVELITERRDDGYYLVARSTSGLYTNECGPFDTKEQVNAALDDLLKMTLSQGAVDVPGGFWRIDPSSS